MLFVVCFLICLCRHSGEGTHHASGQKRSGRGHAASWESKEQAQRPRRRRRLLQVPLARSGGLQSHVEPRGGSISPRSLPKLTRRHTLVHRLHSQLRLPVFIPVGHLAGWLPVRLLSGWLLDLQCPLPSPHCHPLPLLHTRPCRPTDHPGVALLLPISVTSYRQDYR